MPENSPYTHLSFALGGTTHTSNEVIASQFRCPTQLSLHEHVAFGNLRSGPHIQWLNILRNMEEGILSFGRHEVNLLHTQAAWQLGPLSLETCTREWHLEPSKPVFANKLVSLAFRILDRVKSNWLESATVGTCVLLVQRLLASQSSSDVVTEAVRFLLKAVDVTFSWVSELNKKLEFVMDDLQAQSYRQQLCEIVAVCRSVYNVADQILPKLLSNGRDYSPLIVCAIILYENRPENINSAPPSLRLLLSRDRLLSHRLARFLVEYILAHPSILHGSISHVWSGFFPQQSNWVRNNSSWLTIKTAQNGGPTQKVDFNLQEGRLLIDGLPIGRIPIEYANHALYVRLFGQRIINIVPSTIPGMIFTARNEIGGYQVSFALDTSNQDMVIQARVGGTTLELIPPSRLGEDFPSSCISDFHHWLNIQDNVMEFRPLSAPWTDHNPSWELSVHDHGSVTMASKTPHETRLLLDLRNSTTQAISRQFSGLESSQHIHITLSSLSQTRVNLPRFHLSFFVNSDTRLESLNFPEYIVDADQSSGTMIGLSSQLILCHRDSLRMGRASRIVIIPEGAVTFSKSGHHVRVVLDPGAGRHLQYHRYNIDELLGCLSSNSGLTGRLFRIYLHALTSNCLPDPLTRRTGTEEALQLLSEPATSSFDRLDESQAKLLCQISELTPRRVYYPVHLKCMQSTTWSNLPMFSQHDAFYGLVESILSQAERLRVFHPDIGHHDSQDLDKSRGGELLGRAIKRDIYFYPPDTPRLSKSASSGANHRPYTGRDAPGTSKWSTNEDLAFWVTTQAKTNWGHPFYTSYDLTEMLVSRETLDGVGNELGLSYTSLWLSASLESWLSIYDVCRRAPASRGPFALVFCLSAAVYGGGLSIEQFSVLLSVATNPQLRALQPPNHTHYNLRDGYKPTHNHVKKIVLASEKPLANTAAPATKKSRVKKSKKHPQQSVSKDSTTLSLATQITELALRQWPSCRLENCPLFFERFDMGECNRAIQKYFASCSRNRDLREHLDQVRSGLPGPLGLMGVVPTRSFTKSLTPLTEFSRDPNLRVYPPNIVTLVCERDTTLGDKGTTTQPPLAPVFKHGSNAPDTDLLKALLGEFTRDNTHPLNRRYGADLDFSRQCFATAPSGRDHSTLSLLSELYSELDKCNRELGDVYATVVATLAPRNVAERLLMLSGIWPRMGPRDILKQLALHLRTLLPQHWISTIVDFSLKFIALQRATRLVELGIGNKYEDIHQEMASLDRDCIASSEDLDWILIQIEGNFSIRPLQAQIAQEMISPTSGRNSLLQLNMGEGKSSVIIPVVAATLAKGDNLVRVVVIKPLWRAMFHLLVTRLGGLAHRRIYYLPFGRHIQPHEEKTKIIQTLYADCMREGGIILAQPEHILSFKLMSINQLMNVESGAGTTLLHQTQSWLDSHSRDILDESDEILSVKYQLVYTVGVQEPLEGHPKRWLIAQELLHLTAKCLNRLKNRFPSALLSDTRPGGRFPFLKIGPDSNVALDSVIKVLANDVLDGQLASLNLLHLGHNAREATLIFLTTKKLTGQAQEFLQSVCDPGMWTGLLLLRGLLACGILGFALREKYYRVNYGLDLNRSLLADVPSLRAEFGHPDVTILLTCLSYYYEGLSEDQLRSCFEMLYKLDNPTLEYDYWVLRQGEVPPEYSNLKGINLKDLKQFQSDIFPLFSCNSAVINFYLATFVFPRSVKEFPHKLVSSAWDLAATKAHPTTGFSGTNDNRYLLPTSISQVDPLNQVGTNALILNRLLQPENNYYLCVKGSEEVSTSKDFVDSLVMQRPTINVLLDVGAQMLDMTNEELVRYWLSLRPDALAAVYFNDNDELLVLSGDEAPSRLVTSPFAQRLDGCIVYLDDSHTRGTDLKLPQDARGAVTLGPKITKDRLTQCCMRMRKLGRGQSVMFFAPPDIDSQIRKAAGAHEKEPIQTHDVLRWAMILTCNDIKHHVGQWVQQGQDYKHRWLYEQQYNDSGDSIFLERCWLQAESRSLEQLYGAASSSTMIQYASTLEDPELRERLEYLGINQIEESRWDEQQEREVSHEIELERQVERPSPLQAAQHTLHKDLLKMVRTGYFPRNSPALCSYFKLAHPGRQKPNPQSSHLFATIDFVTAVVGSPRETTGYMRPVNWILSGISDDLIIISPYEANSLLPQIRSDSAVTLHVYAPRVTSDMRSFSDLNFYRLTSPSVLMPAALPGMLARIQLILWSGQLYIDDHQQYLSICAFLGLYVPNSNDGTHAIENLDISSDGFINPAKRQFLINHLPEYAMCRFDKSPVPMLRDLFGSRRMGMDYARTHLGQILHGRLLTKEDFN